MGKGGHKKKCSICRQIGHNKNNYLKNLWMKWILHQKYRLRKLHHLLSLLTLLTLLITHHPHNKQKDPQQPTTTEWSGESIHSSATINEWKSSTSTSSTRPTM